MLFLACEVTAGLALAAQSQQGGRYGRNRKREWPEVVKGRGRDTQELSLRLLHEEAGCIPRGRGAGGLRRHRKMRKGHLGAQWDTKHPPGFHGWERPVDKHLFC